MKYIASCSCGKDSLAMILMLIEKNGRWITYCFLMPERNSNQYTEIGKS